MGLCFTVHDSLRIQGRDIVDWTNLSLHMDQCQVLVNKLYECPQRCDTMWSGWLVRFCKTTRCYNVQCTTNYENPQWVFFPVGSHFPPVPYETEVAARLWSRPGWRSELLCRPYKSPADQRTPEEGPICSWFLLLAHSFFPGFLPVSPFQTRREVYVLI